MIYVPSLVSFRVCSGSEKMRLFVAKEKKKESLQKQ